MQLFQIVSVLGFLGSLIPSILAAGNCAENKSFLDRTEVGGLHMTFPAVMNYYVRKRLGEHGDGWANIFEELHGSLDMWDAKRLHAAFKLINTVNSPNEKKDLLDLLNSIDGDFYGGNDQDKLCHVVNFGVSLKIKKQACSKSSCSHRPSSASFPHREINVPDGRGSTSSGPNSGGSSSTADRFMALAKGVFDAQNRARINPKSFAEELRKFGDEEAAEICLKTAPIPNGVMADSPGMKKAAMDHVSDRGPAGLMGHVGRDGSKSRVRMSRYGVCHGFSGENIQYGSWEPEAVMASLIKSPGHYKNIFNGNFKVAGVACGPHNDPKFNVMCVLTYVGAYDENQVHRG